MTEERFQLSYCWPVSGNVSPEKGLLFLKAWGFSGVELWPQSLEKFGVARWAKALQETGMHCFQLCPYFDFVSGRGKLDSSRKILEEYLSIASDLSCLRLRVFTGPPWGNGMVGSHSATERQWGSAISGLREFCDRAPKIEFCLECHDGVLMDSSPATLRLLHSIDRQNVSTNLQLPLASEKWEETVEQLGPYTTHMHLHNWTQGLGSGELTCLGQGAFDWRPVTRRLLEMGRNVCLSVEHADHDGRHNPWNTATHDGRFLSALCEECGALQ